jgi:hypothetical protein
MLCCISYDRKTYSGKLQSSVFPVTYGIQLHMKEHLLWTTENKLTDQVESTLSDREKRLSHAYQHFLQVICWFYHPHCYPFHFSRISAVKLDSSFPVSQKLLKNLVNCANLIRPTVKSGEIRKWRRKRWRYLRDVRYLLSKHCNTSIVASILRPTNTIKCEWQVRICKEINPLSLSIKRTLFQSAECFVAM